MQLLRIFAFCILATNLAFGQADDFKNFPIKLGDTYERVKEIYPTPLEPEPYRSNGTQQGTQLRLKTKGVWFFFSREGKIYTMRFDAPFGGTIGGVKIGDSFLVMERKLGKPVKTPSLPLSSILPRSFIYYLDDITTARFQVNGDDEIETIYLNK